MEQERWRIVLEVYEAVAELPEAERRAILESASPEIREAVITLLDGLDEPNPSSVPTSQPIVSGEPRSGQLGHYTVLKSLGTGGMGEVYSAHDTRLDRIVALKFLSPDALGTSSVKRLIREAKAASALNHPNIVTVHEVIEFDSELAIVMELVDGVALRRMLGAPLPFSKLACIGRQIAEALTAAHARGIIHRDIKPENIMVRQDGYVKLLDFGLARRTDSGQTSNSGLAAGTLRYMSPEQARGGEMTAATDVFSLGIVLYECATGQHPFSGESPFETAHRILTAPPLSLSTIREGVPPELEQLLLSMLSKDGQSRPSAQAVQDQLNPFSAQQPPMPGHRSLRPTARRGKLKWIPAAAVVAVCGLAVWWWLNQAREPSITFRQLTTQVPENRVIAAAISNDGKRLAYASVDGIFLRIIATGETQPLRAPAGFLVDKLAWFNDDLRLVVGGFFSNTDRPAIWSVSVLNEAPRLLREEARQPVPSPDGSKVAFTNSDGTEVWIAAASGADAKRLIGSSEHRDQFSVLHWSADGSALGYQRRPNDPRLLEAGPAIIPEVNMAAYSYESVDATNGRELFRRQGMLMYSAFTLPGGHVLCLRPNIRHPHWNFELWELETDVRTLRVRQARLKTSLPYRTWYSSLTATADGKQAVVVKEPSSQSIFIGDFSSKSPQIHNLRRLTLDEKGNFPHAWTPDCRSIIFESDRAGGKNDLFRQNIDSRIPETLLATPQDEDVAVLEPNAKWLLFTQGTTSVHGISTEADPLRLMRMPVAGGMPEPVPIGGHMQEYSCAAPGGKRCVLKTPETGRFFVYHELDPVSGKGRELARTRWTRSIYGDWGISPDGTEVALPIHDSLQAALRIVSLEGGPERHIILKGFSNINGLNWTADGKGWFVAVNTGIGMQMMHLDRNGHATHLLEASYALPSPDGRKVALVIPSIAGNAWMYEGL